MNHKDTLLLYADHPPNTITKKSIIECASFPLSRRYIECEAICGVWLSHPPPSTCSQLWQLGGGDEGSEIVAGLRQRGNCTVLKAEGFNGSELSFC